MNLLSEGKTCSVLGGTSYYVSTVPHPEVGMRVPKTGTTSVYFIWQKGNAKKLYRLDTAHTGANFNHHNSGILNAGQAKDPHHGDKPNTSFNPRRATFSWYNFWSSEQLQYGPDPKPCCKKATESQIKDCIRSFATSYKGRWSYPWGPNCHTFVNDAMSACCLEK